jgi:hypothetical protein
MVTGDGSELFESGCPVGYRLTLCVEQSEAKCLQHTDAAVIGRRAADSHDKMPTALIDCIDVSEPFRESIAITAFIFVSFSLHAFCFN